MEPSNTSGSSLPFDPFSVIVSSPASDPVASFSLPPSSSTAALATPARPASRPAPAFSSTPTPHFPGLSPSPSTTPAHPAFNPDDFFASPPQPCSSPAARARFTPELKRRLFGPADPLQSAPSTLRKSNPASSSLGLTTPIPTAAFANPLSTDASDAGHPDLTISPAFSPSALLAEVVPPPPPPQLPKQDHKQQKHQPQLQTTPSFQPFNSKELASLGIPAVPQKGPPLLPGTPFTPAATQKTKCSCKASKCLKLYCPCFANSGFCGPDCTCKNCQNTHVTAHSVREARETVLARDPRAFEPKVKNSLAAACGDIHTKGCNCRKGCGKNYCVCRELRVDCGPRCTCSGPHGCLNGKRDALEDHEFKGKAERILGASKSRPRPCHMNGGFPPTKTLRVKSASGGRVKQDRKRQKRETPAEAISRIPSNNDIADVLSPSFPSFSFSPATGLKENIDVFRRVLADGSDEFAPPFSLEKDSQNQPNAPDQKGGAETETLNTSNAMAGTEETILMTTSLPRLPPQLSSQVSTGPEDSGKEGELLLQNGNKESDKENNMNVQNGEQLGNIETLQAVDKKRRPSPVKLEMEFDEAACEKQLLQTGNPKTPERRQLVGDMEAASSPTTHGKETRSRSWGTLGNSLFGKEEKIEICRLPRILRVKMGSGRLLRKFEM